MDAPVSARQHTGEYHACQRNCVSQLNLVMIRVATKNDTAAIAEIYNQAVVAGFQTAYTTVFDEDNRDSLLEGHDDRYPIFVFEDEGKILGWLSVSPYRAGRGALRHTIEISYFLDGNFRKRGIGSALMEHALTAVRYLGYKAVLLIIIEGNEASIALARKFGFEQWGRLPGVAEFNGVECNQVYYGKRLP